MNFLIFFYPYLLLKKKRANKLLLLSSYTLYMLIGIQRLPIENTLYRKLDSSRYEGSAPAHRRGGGNL